MSLIETRLQNLRVNSDLDKNMARPSRYGALDLFVEQSYARDGIITDELRERAFAANGREVQIPVIDYDGDVTISNVRSCDIADDENTSKLVNVTFVTYAFGFTMVPTLYDNNEIRIQKDWERKFLKYLYKLADTLDAGAVAALSANKTQVFKELLTYTQAGNSIQVPWVQREDALADFDAMMAANDYFGRMHIVGNAGIQALVTKLAQHGLYNDVDKRNEYLNKIFHFTNNVTNEASAYASGYAVEHGNVGMLFRVDREALRRTDLGPMGEWDITTLPVLNIPVGTFFKDSVGNYSTIAGAASADMTCVHKEYYGFSVDVAYLVAYNSDPTEIANPIMKFDILKSTMTPVTTIPVQVVNPAESPVNTKEVVGA